MTSIILVGCGKSKSAAPAPAADLYLGSLFRAARGYAEASGCPWHIVSGLHGLVDPGEVLEPYDNRIPGGREPMSVWGERVWASLVDRYGYGTELEVEVLAGVCYVLPIQIHAPAGCRILDPLFGLRVGERLAWFKAQRVSRAA